MKHLISIITPTFNCENHIYECLSSVRSQNLSEIVKHIVVDGESTDKTLEIVRDFKDVDLISEPDLGQSDAFNKGIAYSNSQWIIILDGDDILTPGSLNRYINSIKNYNPDIVYGHQNFIDENSNIIKTNTSIIYKKEFILSGLFIPPSSGLCFRASILKNNLFDINHHYNMDTEWFLRYQGKLQSKVISYPTSGFRVWSGSKTFSLSNAFSNKLEDNSKKDEITKERIILYEKYYAPYQETVSKKFKFYKIKSALIYCDFILNKLIMKLRFILISKFID